MKTLPLAAAAIAALVTPALAGGPTIIADDPVPAAAPAPAAALDWSGAYAGLSLGQTGGTITNPGATFDYDSDSAVGAFFGYNLQRGRFVYGGELGFTSTETVVVGGGGDDTVDSLFDLRGRLGVAAGKSLIYGSLGYSAADLTINGTNSASLSGVSYGVGVDFALGGTMFLGLDYTRRTVDGQTDTGTFDLDSDIDTLSLRAGINF